MNRTQALFLASVVVPFGLLYSLQTVVVSRLNSAGFYFSDFILIGLPKDATNPDGEKHTFNQWIMPLHTIEIPGLGEVDLLSPPVLGAAAVVVLTVAYFALFSSKKPAKVLDSATFKTFPLVQKTQVSPNTAIYRFGLPTSNSILGLPTGQHISVAANINGKDIMRSYTPMSSDDDLGHFDLLIKSYEKGNISRLFGELKVGDNIKVKGPKGQFNYSPDLVPHIGMIAGGTGITPMWQIIHAALKNPSDKTKLSLLYANVNFEDILLKQELDALALAHPTRFKIYYVLNNPPAGWTGGVGFVTKEMIQERLPESSSACKVLMCGPPPMITAMKKNLDDLKFAPPRTVSKLPDQVFVF